MKRRLGTPSPAFVVSLIALFVALGGTTYAATSLPKGSVGTAQLKSGAVTKTKINKMTISVLKGQRGPQGANGAPGATGAAGQPGPSGPKGDTGSAGTNGTDGTNGTNGTNGVSVSSGTLAQGNANCPNGGSSFTAANGTTYACNGTTGSQGPPGPTAAATDSGTGTPATNPTSETGGTATVTTTTSSKLLVTGWTQASITCQSASACSDNWGLYVDGTPVPGSNHVMLPPLGGTDSEFVLTTGMTGTLPAGTHTVVLQDDPAGPWKSIDASFVRVVAIAIGS